MLLELFYILIWIILQSQLSYFILQSNFNASGNLQFLFKLLIILNKNTFSSCLIPFGIILNFCKNLQILLQTVDPTAIIIKLIWMWFDQLIQSLSPFIRLFPDPILGLFPYGFKVFLMFYSIFLGFLTGFL